MLDHAISMSIRSLDIPTHVYRWSQFLYIILLRLAVQMTDWKVYAPQ